MLMARVEWAFHGRRGASSSEGGVELFGDVSIDCQPKLIPDPSTRRGLHRKLEQPAPATTPTEQCSAQSTARPPARHDHHNQPVRRNGGSSESWIWDRCWCRCWCPLSPAWLRAPVCISRSDASLTTNATRAIGHLPKPPQRSRFASDWWKAHQLLGPDAMTEPNRKLSEYLAEAESMVAKTQELSRAHRKPVTFRRVFLLYRMQRRSARIVQWLFYLSIFLVVILAAALPSDITSNRASDRSYVGGDIGVLIGVTVFVLLLRFLAADLEHRTGTGSAVPNGQRVWSETEETEPNRADAISVISADQTDSPHDPQWLEDPTGHHQYRYWDGKRWTEHTADDGTTSDDPLKSSEQAAPSPPMSPATTKQDSGERAGLA